MTISTPSCLHCGQSFDPSSLGGQRIIDDGHCGCVSDMVNHPPHYKSGGIESIDVIDAFNLGFCLGNVVKYVLRSGRKGSTVEDLKKAQWYLNRELTKREKS